MSEADDKLEATRKMIAELTASMSELSDEEQKININIREQNRVLSQLNSQRLSVANKANEIKRELAEAKRLVEQQEKEAAQEAENERVRQEYERQNAMFDEQMLKYNWGDKAKPHQIEAGKKLAIAKRGILGDKRGLGKTLSSIIWADLSGSRKVLCIVPNDVRGNFVREVNYWAPHRSVVDLGGMSKIQRNALLGVFKDLEDIFVVINYEAWRKDNNLLQLLISCQFDSVIADEAHMLKEMDTNAFRGVKTLVFAENACPVCGSSNFETRYSSRACFDCKYEQEEWGEFCSVKKVLPMTGTPILNKPQDIFPLLHLVNPIMFRDKSDFLYSYCEKNRYNGKWEFQWGGAERLATRLSGIYIARDRYKAGVEIPKQSIQVHELDMDSDLYPKQWEAYQILKQKSALIVDDMLSEEENKGVKPILYMIALITRLRQMAVWPAGIEFRNPDTKELLFKTDVTESVKLDYATDLAKQLINDEQERVVLFSQFKQPLIELERRLLDAGISVVRYDGDTPSDLRQRIQIDFDRKYQQEGKPHRWDIVLGHYKTGGTGINLNAATQMIILDEEWNPGKEDQAYGRIDRMGQDEETTVHVLRVNDSIDEWMAKLISDKRDMIEGFEVQADLQQELLDILRSGK